MAANSLVGRPRPTPASLSQTGIRGTAPTATAAASGHRSGPRYSWRAASAWRSTGSSPRPSPAPAGGRSARSREGCGPGETTGRTGPARRAGRWPLPDGVTVHLDAGHDSAKTCALLSGRGLHGRIAHKGEKAPIQAIRRWHVERTHAWQNAFHRLARCYERSATVIDAFFGLADTIITVRSLIRRSWTSHCSDGRPIRRGLSAGRRQACAMTSG